MKSVNNHIHTTYSFSPYSPSLAAEKAAEAGLASAGIMDHDSVGGAFEFINACKKVGIASTVGFECRVNMKNTKFFDRRLNNPDQVGIAYVTLHGIPHQHLADCEKFLKPYRDFRNKRNRLMVDNINSILTPYGITVDFEKDVVPLSNYPTGSITERHLLFAVSKKIIAKYGVGSDLVSFLKNTLNIQLSAKAEGFLSDAENQIAAYDLLGVLKSSLIERIYIPADDECPDVKVFLDFASRIGAIPAYAYLGDVGDSVTGDKKAQKFEDDYLDELFDELNNLGFHALSYMPSRNTLSQLERVMSLCKKYGFFEISGEDINSPRQSFICPALSKPEFLHLTDSTWALIGHEIAATFDQDNGFLSASTIAHIPDLSDRIEYFKNIGLKGEYTK